MISSQALKTFFFFGLLMLAVSASNAAAAGMDPAIMDANIPDGMSLDAISEDDNTGGSGMRFLRGTTEDQGHRELNSCKVRNDWCMTGDECCSGQCWVVLCN